MILSPSRKLWTPADGWDWLNKFTSGKWQRASSGKLKRNSSTGKMRTNSASVTACCCGAYYKVKKCSDNSYVDLWVAGPLSGTTYFVHEQVCYYVADTHTTGTPTTIVTPTTTYANCAACQVYYQAISCSSGLTVDAWLHESDLSLPTPYYFYKSGLGCCVFADYCPTSTTPGTLLTGETSITSCADTSPPGADCVANDCCTDQPFITSFIATLSGQAHCDCGDFDFEYTSGTLANGTHTLSTATGLCGYQATVSSLVYTRCSAPFDTVSLTGTLRCGIVLPLGAPAQINLTYGGARNCSYAFDATEIETLCEGGTVSGTLSSAGVCQDCSTASNQYGGPISFSVSRG